MTESKKTPTETIEEEIKARLEQEEALYPDITLNDGTISSVFVKMCLDAKELGDGILYTVMNKDKFIYNVTSEEWLKWAGHYWEEDDYNQHLAAVENIVDRLLQETSSVTEKINDAVKVKNTEVQSKYSRYRDGLYKRISQLRKVRGRNSCINFAISCKNPITTKESELDLKPWLLGCPNGIIDLRSGKFRDGRPEEYITKVCPTAWTDYDEKAPEWEKYILDIMNGDQELVDFMQRLLGYAITGLTREHIMAVFWGKGRNGKGTLVRMIEHVMGSLSGTIPTELLLYQRMQRSSAGPSPDIVDLKGLRMAFASETEEGQRFSASRVKWLTGGDQLVGRNLNEKKQIRFDPTHTIFLMTNNKPSVAGDDYAFWKRMLLIPFVLSYVSKPVDELEESERVADPDIEERLKAEASGILAWLVRGCIEYQDKGLIPPQAVKDATLEYMQEEDLLGNFVDRYLDHIKGEKTKSGEIYEKFSKWFKKNNGPKASISHKRFGTMMKRKYTSTKISGVVHYKDIKLNGNIIELAGDD